jgi:hypothetical protein
MNLKAAIALGLTASFLALTFNQVGFVAAATGDNPITSPITFPGQTPTPTPVPTPPITFPVNQFQVTGNVTYKDMKTGEITPAFNVAVKFTNKANGQVTKVRTDQNGNYTVTLNKGEYTFYAQDSKGTYFDPPLRYVNLQSSVSGLNFEGRIF